MIQAQLPEGKRLMNPTQSRGIRRKGIAALLAERHFKASFFAALLLCVSSACRICLWTDRARRGMLPGWRKGQLKKRGAHRERDFLLTGGRRERGSSKR